MTASELFLFMGKCLAMDGHPGIREEVASTVSGGKIIWEEFVWTASSQFVLPALYSSFERNGILPLLPEDLSEHLAQIYNLNLERNTKIVRQCLDLIAILSPSGIRPVFIKGSGLLLSGLFPEMGDRLMEDIDILLPEEEMYKAVGLLASGGYLFHDQEDKEEVYPGHHHLPPMYHPRHIATLEIHRRPVHDEYGAVLPSASLLKNALEMDLAGTHSNQENKIPGKKGADSLHATDPDGRGKTESQNGHIKIRIPSSEHSLWLVYLHEHRMARGSLSAAGTLKGAFDFYLLTRLHPADSSQMPEGKWRKGFLRYVRAMEKVMGTGLSEQQQEEQNNRFREWWWSKELFLLNHPLIDRFYHRLVYAPVVYLKLLVRSIGSSSARKQVAAKIRKFLLA